MRLAVQGKKCRGAKEKNIHEKKEGKEKTAIWSLYEVIVSVEDGKRKFISRS